MRLRSRSSAQLPEGHIEVRLVGQDPTLVYVGEEEAPQEPAAGVA